jgi:hypothetical protein
MQHASKYEQLWVYPWFAGTTHNVHCVVTVACVRCQLMHTTRGRQHNARYFARNYLCSSGVQHPRAVHMCATSVLLS